MMTSAAGNRMECGPGGQRGFTLIEVIVVLVILSAVLAISYPSLSRGSATLQLRAAGRDVLNTFRVAREKSIAEQTEIRLAVDGKNGQLILTDALGRGMRRYALPEGVEIEHMGVRGKEAAQQTLVVHFLPNGGFESVEVLLKSRFGSRLRIVSDPARGGVRIETGQGEDAP